MDVAVGLKLLRIKRLCELLLNIEAVVGRALHLWDKLLRCLLGVSIRVCQFGHRGSLILLVGLLHKIC